MEQQASCYFEVLQTLINAQGVHKMTPSKEKKLVARRLGGEVS